MSSGLVVTETTNDVYLADVYVPMTVQVRTRVVCTARCVVCTTLHRPPAFELLRAGPTVDADLTCSSQWHVAYSLAKLDLDLLRPCTTHYRVHECGSFAVSLLTPCCFHCWYYSYAERAKLAAYPPSQLDGQQR